MTFVRRMCLWMGLFLLTHVAMIAGMKGLPFAFPVMLLFAVAQGWVLRDLWKEGRDGQS